jgi:recombination protein RecA
MSKRKISNENTIEENFGNIEEAFQILSDLNPEATFLDDNSLSSVNEWIDTGCLALNAIISGSLYGGIPMGRLTGFVGPESCGKTLMANKIMANAQKKGMHVAYFDTEGALDENTAKRLGCDTSKIKHVPSEITEQCRNQIVKFLDTVIEKKLQGKVLIVIDSIGNLITTQEKKKIDEGNEAPDMGNRAKALKSMMRAITHSAAKANCPLIFTNHIYDDPSQLHPSDRKSVV